MERVRRRPADRRSGRGGRPGPPPQRRRGRRAGPARHGHPDPFDRQDGPPPVHPAAPDAPDESVSTWFDRDGRFFMSAELDADRGRIVDAALSAARRPAVPRWRPCGDVGGRVDRHLRTVAGRRDPERRDRFRINMFFDLTDPVPARWADRSPVPDSIRQHLTCDGTFTPTFVGTARRCPSAPAVPGIRNGPDGSSCTGIRDVGCRGAPGPAGSTSTTSPTVNTAAATEMPNLVALCRRCHRAHHRGQFGIHGNADTPDGLTFTTPPATPSPPPPTSPHPTRRPPTPTTPTNTHPANDSTAAGCSSPTHPRTPRDPPGTSG